MEREILHPLEGLLEAGGVLSSPSGVRAETASVSLNAQEGMFSTEFSATILYQLYIYADDYE